MVDVVGLVVVGGQVNVSPVLDRIEAGYVFLIQNLNVVRSYLVHPEVVQQLDKLWIRLPVDMFQLDVNGLASAQRVGVEKVGIGIIAVHERPLLVFYHRGQLPQVADKEYLNAAKGLAFGTAYKAQHGVDGIKQIGPEHAHLINNKQFHFLNERPFGSMHVQVFNQAVWGGHLKTDFHVGIETVFGDEGAKGQVKKRMQRDATRVNGCNACGCCNHCFFVGGFHNLFQQGGFPGPGLAG